METKQSLSCRGWRWYQITFGRVTTELSVSIYTYHLYQLHASHISKRLKLAIFHNFCICLFQFLFCVFNLVLTVKSSTRNRNLTERWTGFEVFCRFVISYLAYFDGVLLLYLMQSSTDHNVIFGTNGFETSYFSL